MAHFNKKKFFELLNIEPTNDLKIINKAYRRYLVYGHPDKGGDSEIFLLMARKREQLTVSSLNVENNLGFEVYEVDYTILFLMIAVSSIVTCALFYIIESSCRQPCRETTVLKP